MKRFLMGAIALLCLHLSALAQYPVIGTKVQDGTGALLASGQWCFNGSCSSVTNGVIASGASIPQRSANVTVLNEAGATVLTVMGVVPGPNLTLNWDQYVLQGVDSSGVGAPYMLCQVGARYQQTDNGQHWTCMSINGGAVWSNGSSAGLTAAQSAALNSALTSSSIGSTVASQSDVVAAQNAATTASAAVTSETTRATAAEQLVSTAAASAAAQAKLAYQASPHIPVTAYGDAGTCTWTMNQPALGSVGSGSKPYTLLPPTFTGGEDDHAAMQAAYNAGGALPITTSSIGRDRHNLLRALVVFPDGKVCRDLTGTISVPIGVGTQGNGATISFATTGNGFDLPYNSSANAYPTGTTTVGSAAGFGRFNDYIEGLNIIGPGASASLGKGIHDQLTNYGVIRNVHESGFKYGVSLNQAQYMKVLDSSFQFNQVGCYVANDYSTPTTSAPQGANNNSLPSIDNNFDHTDCNANTRFGFWQQDGSQNRFQNGDWGFNGSVDILIGGQLRPYLQALTMTGGSGCTVSGVNRVATTTGATIQPEAVFSSDSSGNPIAGSLLVTDGGENVTGTLTFSVPTCTTAPTFTSTIINDQSPASTLASLGDYQGTLYGNNDLIFNNLKAETQNPIDTGYSVIIGTPGGTTLPHQVVFNHYIPADDALYQYSQVASNITNNGYPGEYKRQVRVAGPFNTFNDVERPGSQDPAFNQRGAWAASTAYAPNDIFNYGGVNYVVTTAFTSGTMFSSANTASETTVPDICSVRVELTGQAIETNYALGVVNETTAPRLACEPNGSASPASHATYTGFDANGLRLIPGLNIGGLAPVQLLGNLLSFGSIETASLALDTTAASPTVYYTAPSGIGAGGMWSDNQYIYRLQTNGHIVEIPWNTFAGDSVANGNAASGVFNAPITAPQLVTTNVLPSTLYSAAGTALPACAVALKGAQYTVSDATAPTYMGAYTSGGAITAAVICSYNGTAYSWLTH